MKTILLTGGSGRIGRCLRYALRDDYRLVLFNRERLGAGDEDLREVGLDAPVARLVRYGQGAPRHAEPKLGQRQGVHPLVVGQVKDGEFVPAEQRRKGNGS